MSWKDILNWKRQNGFERQFSSDKYYKQQLRKYNHPAPAVVNQPVTWTPMTLIFSGSSVSNIKINYYIYMYLADDMLGSGNNWVN